MKDINKNKDKDKKKRNNEFKRLIEMVNNQNLEVENNIPNGGFLNIIKCNKKERIQLEKNSDRAFEISNKHKIISILDILNSKKIN